jgi:hypothetical protein
VITLVDSNVLLDLATDTRGGRTGLIGFETIEEIESLLPTSEFRRLDLPYEAAFLAGKAFLAYRRRGGTRTAPLPDFYIGAHAAVAGLRLLTRDARRYRSYFPSVPLIAP